MSRLKINPSSDFKEKYQEKSDPAPISTPREAPNKPSQNAKRVESAAVYPSPDKDAPNDYTPIDSVKRSAELNAAEADRSIADAHQIIAKNKEKDFVFLLFIACSILKLFLFFSANIVLRVIAAPSPLIVAFVCLGAFLGDYIFYYFYFKRSYKNYFKLSFYLTAVFLFPTITSIYIIPIPPITSKMTAILGAIVAGPVSLVAKVVLFFALSHCAAYFASKKTGFKI